MYGIPPDELAMQQREAAEAEMLSIEEIDEWMAWAKDQTSFYSARLIAFEELCAMARRSALSEAAGKEIPTEPLWDDFKHGDNCSGPDLRDCDCDIQNRYNDAHDEYVIKLRAHATALQSKLVEAQLAADDANLSAIAAKEETELLRKRLAEVEAENARLKAHNKVLTDTVTSCGAALCRAEDAETRLREVTAERDALVSCADYNAPEQPCKGCSKPLLIENAWMEDGCPCNTPAGVNNANLFRWNLLHKLQQKQSHDLTAAHLRAETAWERAKEACAKVCEQTWKSAPSGAVKNGLSHGCLESARNIRQLRADSPNET